MLIMADRLVRARPVKIIIAMVRRAFSFDFLLYFRITFFLRVGVSYFLVSVGGASERPDRCNIQVLITLCKMAGHCVPA